MNMLTEIMKELEITRNWEYRRGLFNEIEQLMRKYGEWCYAEGVAHAENSRIVNSQYGRKEDQE